MIEIARKRGAEAGKIPGDVAIADFTNHDIRRTMTTHMAKLGIAPHVCEAVLNHSSGTISGVAAVYNRWKFNDEKRDALQKWADHVDLIVGRFSSGNVTRSRGKPDLMLARTAESFKYTAEVATIAATLHSRPFTNWPDVDQLETLAILYIFSVSRARGSLPKKQIAKEKAERNRIVERVRRAVRVGDRAERIEAIVERMVADSIDVDDPLSQFSRTRLLAQAMFDGEITEFELERLIVRHFLSQPGKLEWPGKDRWIFADDRERRHRFEYVKQLVCYWAEDRNCRPTRYPCRPARAPAVTG